MKRKVWIVESGEKHEGGVIHSLHEKRSTALAAASKERPAFGPWRVVEKSPERVLWESGCDWLSVTRREVLP